MREILELCVEMDMLAERLYAGLARACPDEDLRRTFGRLERDEAEHTGWWAGLLEAWDQGLLPDVVNETEDLSARLRKLGDDLAAIDMSKLAEAGCDRMLALAARVEFHMMDPVFGELIDLTEPAQAERRRTAYQAHLQRLVDAIGDHYPGDTLAGMLATALSRTWRDNLRLAVYATHDMLTGLYNRRALQTQLPQWAAWSARYGHPLTVLLVDVDRFKSVNDTFGHGDGDRALQAVAHALKQTTRASDLVLRYGGDEFAVIAPETGADQYRELCSRIAASVRAIDLQSVTGTRIHLTVSIGGVIALAEPGSTPRRVEGLLAAADRSLYSAKLSGRDCVALPVEDVASS